MDYGFIHEGKTFTPNGTPNIDPTTSDARNRDLERAELARWNERPTVHLAYYDDKTRVVSTWLGTQIGTITTCHIYRHNFGARMITLTVQGNNGAQYHGRASYDNGTCIRLRRCK